MAAAAAATTRAALAQLPELSTPDQYEAWKGAVETAVGRWRSDAVDPSRRSEDGDRMLLTLHLDRIQGDHLEMHTLQRAHRLRAHQQPHGARVGHHSRRQIYLGGFSPSVSHAHLSDTCTSSHTGVLMQS